MGRIASIHALRGISALMVCVAHFFSTHNPQSPELVRQIVGVGIHGVTMFFVISGFVLPLVLSRVDYSIASFPRFMLKRIVRLEPPYLVAILLVVALQVAASNAPGYQGEPYVLDPWGLVAHIGYLPPLVGKPWVVGVFWTLLIEAQFYILIGLTFTIFRRHPIAWIVVLAVPSAFVTSWHGLPYHLPMFLIGTAAFAWRAAMIRGNQAAAIALALAVYLSIYRGGDYALFALAAAAYILWTAPKSRALLFFGTISYSLYLIHQPFGVKVIHFAERFGVPGLIAGTIALAVAVMLGWLLWFLVERPASRLASRINYQPSEGGFHKDREQHDVVRRRTALDSDGKGR